MAIRSLPVVTEALTAGAVFPVSPANTADSSYQATLSQLLTFFESNFASPDFTVVRSSPIAGFVQNLSAQTTNVWLILTPAGTLAAGTVQLPPAASAFDGQMVMVTSTQTISALTVTSTGATVVGAPAGASANATFVLRYNTDALSWYSLGANPSVFGDITITGDILDANGNKLLDFFSVPAAVNSFAVSNAATTDAVVVGATGSDTDIDVDFLAKGAGIARLSNEDSTAGVEITGTTVNIDTNFGTINLNAPSTTCSALVGTEITGNGVTGDRLTTTGSTVAALPAAAAGNAGQRRHVTNATLALTAGIGTAVVGGGANTVPVFSDGGAWRIG